LGSDFWRDLEIAEEKDPLICWILGNLKKKLKNFENLKNPPKFR
jgi:hypothetical protein